VIRGFAFACVLVTLLSACATKEHARTRVTIPSPGECSPIDVAVAPEVAPQLRTIAERFNRSAAARTAPGTCSFVRTWSIESATAARQLLAGWPKPQLDGPPPAVWIPASSAWPELVNERSRVRGGADLATVGPSLARSRVVIAMPQPLAKALHAPATWAAFAAVARQGWAAVGHPEWGAFQFGKANPTLSSDALLATLALERDGTDATALEASVVAYGSSPRAFLDNWMQADESRTSTRAMAAVASAVVTDERAVRAYNAGSTKGSLPVDGNASAPPIKLVGALPAGAALTADHPFVVVGDATPGVRAFEQFAQTPDAAALFKAAGFRPGAPSTHAPAAVAAALDRWASRRKPGRLLVLFDVSDSMRDSAGRSNSNRSKLALAKIALVDALGRLGADDEIGLRIFTTKLRHGTSTDWKDVVAIGRSATVHRRLVHEIRSLRPLQGSPLYAATRDAYNEIHHTVEPDAINGVVLLTDGYNEDDSNNDRSALLQHLTGDRRVHIYTIALGSDADVSTLKRIASATNGGYYGATNPINIEGAFADALSNF
jgi:Ca-activated chloride channel family protein